MGRGEDLGKEVRPGVYRLSSFSEHIPLAPEDEVTVSDGLVTGIESLADVFLVEVYFYLRTSETYVSEVADMWGRDTHA